MANRMSVATIDSPEFINIESVNPLISKCEIKVLYVGENRNNSFITKEVATNMAKTLPVVLLLDILLKRKKTLEIMVSKLLLMAKELSSIN